MTHDDRRDFIKATATLSLFGMISGEASAKTLSSMKAGPITVRAGESRTGQPQTIAGRPFASTKIAGNDVGGRYATFVLNTPPGRGPELHIHVEQNEWFFILDGTIGLQCGNDRVVLHPGDSFLAPAGVPHAYIALGSTVSRMINLFDPAGQMEAFFAAYATVVDSPDVPDKRSRLASLYESHGMHLTGAPLARNLFDS